MRRTAGFTLLETLVALAVLGTVLSAVFGVYSSSLRGLSRSDESTFAILRQNRGGLIKRPQNASPQIVAAGRDGWVGWVELKKEAVNVIATRMTAQVIRDVKADRGGRK